MTTNRLAKSTEIIADRKSWTLQQHCDHANAQLILNETNEYRRTQKLPAVHWVIRGDRIVCEIKPSPLALAHGN